MHTLMLNWAAWACGTIGVENSRSRPVADPIVADAEAVEEALLELKRQHEHLFDAMMYRYRNRWMDVSSADKMQISIPGFRKYCSDAYLWLDGYLSRE